MPKTAPDPVELKKHSVRQKLISIALIALLVGATNAYMAKRGEKPQAELQSQRQSSKKNESILGESTEVSARARDSFIDEASDTIQTTASTVEKSTQQLIDETKDKVNTSFNELIYTTTIKPLIDKIQSLPPDQRENIQDAICKQAN